MFEEKKAEAPKRRSWKRSRFGNVRQDGTYNDRITYHIKSDVFRQVMLDAMDEYSLGANEIAKLCLDHVLAGGPPPSEWKRISIERLHAKRERMRKAREQRAKNLAKKKADGANGVVDENADHKGVEDVDKYRLLYVSDIVKLLRVDIRTVKSWIEDGLLKTVPGGKRSSRPRISRLALDEFLKGTAQ